MMMKTRLISIGCICAMAAVVAMAQDGAGKNVEALLKQILSSQQQMQESIQQLQTKINQQDNEISGLKKQLMIQEEKVQQQAQQVQEQVKALEERPAAASAGPSALDILASREQYEVARDLQHHTIFNVRRGLQNEWFERVVQEFNVVVENYPEAPEAPEAQIRIARTYHRYLDDKVKAKEAYQKLLNNYPQSEYVDEAREAISKL